MACLHQQLPITVYSYTFLPQSLMKCLDPPHWVLTAPAPPEAMQLPQPLPMAVRQHWGRTPMAHQLPMCM